MTSQAIPAAAVEFTARLIATDKREWHLTLSGIHFVIVRSEPVEKASWLLNPRKQIECIDDWTLVVVADDGSQVEVHRFSGMWRNADPRYPAIAECTADRIATLMDRAREYVRCVQRLAVMLDKLMAEGNATTAKARKLREAAVLALRFHRVVITPDAVALVANDAVLIVGKHHGELIELTYRVGDPAVHGAFNLAYIGEITSISARTITVVDRDKTHRMKHLSFVRYNCRPIEVAYRRNAEWCD